MPEDRSVGSKAYLYCQEQNGWKLMSGDSGVQECVHRPDGTLAWTKPSTCVISEFTL